MALLLLTFGKRPQDQGSAPTKRAAATSPATEQTLRTPTVASASMQDLRNAPLAGCSCINTVEMLPDTSAASADVVITSLDDVVSKLALEPEDSAAAL